MPGATKGGPRFLPSSSLLETTPTTIPTFQDAFAPLVHHLFPDGAFPQDLPKYNNNNNNNNTNNNRDNLNSNTLNSDSDDSDSDDMDLSTVWPDRMDRSAISPKDAWASISQLRLVAKHHGLTPSQLWAVTLTACSTMTMARTNNDSPIAATMGADPPSGGGDEHEHEHPHQLLNSPLVDGTTRCFRALLRCLLPNSFLPLGIPIRLLHAATTTTTTNDTHTTGSSSMDVAGQVSVLRFLTLTIRTSALATAQDRHSLSPLYAIVFHILTGGAQHPHSLYQHHPQPPRTTTNNTNNLSISQVAPDAVRFLHAMTRKRHVRVDRAKRLRQCYDTLLHPPPPPLSSSSTEQSAATTVPSSAVRRRRQRPSIQEQQAKASIFLLLQLYARYDANGCASFVPFVRKMPASVLSQCFQIPNVQWEQEFAGTFRLTAPRPATPTGGESNVPALPAKDRKTAVVSQLHHRPAKHPRSSELRINTNNTDPSQPLSATLEWLEHAFEGVHSFSRSHNDTTAARRTVLRASDLLMDESLRHLICLSANANQSTNHAGNLEVLRFRVCLPFMLHEEWYHSDHNDSIPPEKEHVDPSSGDDDSSEMESSEEDPPRTTGSTTPIQSNPSPTTSSRLSILRALSSLASHADQLFPEVESFVLEEILPHWDGSDESVGRYLCHELLPVLTPCSFGELNSKVLHYLSPLCIYGSPSLQYCILSGALTKLVRRWARLEWSSLLPRNKHSTKKGHGGGVTTGAAAASNLGVPKTQTLRELIRWTDTLIVKSFLITGGHELLNLASCDFFDAVADLSLQIHWVATPSASIVYRLLLSRTALGIDRMCRLLVRYKVAFQAVKEKCELDDPGCAKLGLDRVAVFNCFIWDFCSVLWRCSPLPPLDSGPNEKNMARARSILFTDLPSEALRVLHRNDSAASALSILHSAAFQGYGLELTNGTNNNKGTLPKASRGKMKYKYIDSLRNEKGMEGLHQFLSTFVSSLAERALRDS